jgi:hypothetical protein
VDHDLARSLALFATPPFAIESLGGVDTMICVDSCHDVMVSEPNWLATTLAERCRLRARDGLTFAPKQRAFAGLVVRPAAL